MLPPSQGNKWLVTHRLQARFVDVFFFSGPQNIIDDVKIELLLMKILERKPCKQIQRNLLSGMQFL